MSTPPATLLASVIFNLQEQPLLHDESIWHNGRRGSIAGWVCVAAGAAINTVGSKSWPVYREKPRGFLELATEILGLTAEQAEQVLCQEEPEDALREARSMLVTLRGKAHP